jgi:hypothetical protein
MGGNFKKSCHPRQEVVAPNQFRGATKRQTWVARVNASIAQARQAIFHDSDSTQPAGLVAQAAPEPQHAVGAASSGTALIACLPIAAVQARLEQGTGRFTLGAPDGPTLADLHRPYPLLQDV